MSTVMRATAGLLALGLVATACSGPSGEPGEHGQGWYSTDLIGGDGDWPVVAWGASFQITIETDAPCGEDPEGDDDDSAEPRDGEPLSLYVTSSDEQVVAIRAVEQEWIEDSDWADDCEVHVRAEAEAVGPGEATIVLRDHTLALVDELDLVVREASSLSLKYEGRSVDFPVAVMSGQTASIRATLHSEAGSALGHDGFETEEDPGEALNTYGCREWICLSGSGDGPLSMVRAFYGNAEESLWVRPVTRAGYLETVVSPVYETDLRVRVYLAVASREGELVLHPSYKVHPAGGRASGYTAYETHFDVVLEEPEDEPRVRVASGGLSEVVDLGGRTEHEGAFWTAAERVVERAENEEPAGCAVAPGGTPARSAAALALAALAGLLRRRRQRSSQTASTAVRRA